MCRILAVVLFLLVIVGLSSGAQLAQIGTRSILRDIGTKGDDVADADAAVDLNATSFKTVLGDTPAKFAIVEFFANWCPSCRNYKPHYEKVARLFNGPNAAHPGIILMTRVDCALKANTKLCDRFSVTYFPMLLWGQPSQFTVGGWEPGKNTSEIKSIENGRTAERLLNWINKQMGSSFGLEDKKFEHEHLLSNSSDPEQIARAVYDVEEATSSALEIIAAHKMIKAGTRASLIKFLQILVAHHPSRRCRKGSAEILVNFDDLYPSDIWIDRKDKTLADDGKGLLQNFHVCGEEVPRGFWIFCRGSKNDTRGFSCGLWVLMHSISVRVDDGESQSTFTTLCDFIHNFFVCEECRQHFYKMCSSVSKPFNKTRDLALWLWDAHNKVNERLMKDEASLGTGDPKYPKMIWPSKQLCPKCHLSSKLNADGSTKTEWDQDEVFEFLVNYYGKGLSSLYKDRDVAGAGDGVAHINREEMTSTNAMVVPVGAALAIAVASCAFGVLACFWRSRQKSRKYRHLHSLKNI